MPGVRGIDPRVSALLLIVDKPSARKGYEDLLASYQAMGMGEEAECLGFLISEKFGADGSNTDEK